MNTSGESINQNPQPTPERLGIEQLYGQATNLLLAHCDTLEKNREQPGAQAYLVDVEGRAMWFIAPCYGKTVESIDANVGSFEDVPTTSFWDLNAIVADAKDQTIYSVKDGDGNSDHLAFYKENEPPHIKSWKSPGSPVDGYHILRSLIMPSEIKDLFLSDFAHRGRNIPPQIIGTALTVLEDRLAQRLIALGLSAEPHQTTNT